jgi:hypothetical protein
MINSSQIAVLMAAAMIIVGVTAPVLAEAQVAIDERGRHRVDIERNNEIGQSIEQSQEACTNDADVEITDDDVVDIGGENEAEVEQANVCTVTQSQAAANTGAIVDESTNSISVSVSKTLNDLCRARPDACA